VMAQLRQRAKQSHRAVEDEAASLLVEAVGGEHPRNGMSAVELIDRARRIREGHPSAWVTEEFLRAAKDDGRA
jgi:hypothetical protein